MKRKFKSTPSVTLSFPDGGGEPMTLTIRLMRMGFGARLKVMMPDPVGQIQHLPTGTIHGPPDAAKVQEVASQRALVLLGMMLRAPENGIETVFPKLISSAQEWTTYASQLENELEDAGFSDGQIGEVWAAYNKLSKEAAGKGKAGN